MIRSSVSLSKENDTVFGFTPTYPNFAPSPGLCRLSQPEGGLSHRQGKIDRIDLEITGIGGWSKF